MSADLHCHTKLSDGSVAIDELVILAKNKGIPTIAVTDHDTFAGATRAKIFGQRHGVEVIHGAEISAFDYQRKRLVHLLCYMCEHPGAPGRLVWENFGEQKKSGQHCTAKGYALVSHYTGNGCKEGAGQHGDL